MRVVLEHPRQPSISQEQTFASRDTAIIVYNHAGKDNSKKSDIVQICLLRKGQAKFFPSSAAGDATEEACGVTSRITSLITCLPRSHTIYGNK